MHTLNPDTSGHVASNTNVSFTFWVVPRHAVLMSYRYLNGSGQSEVLGQRHLNLVLHGRLVIELHRLKDEGAPCESGDGGRKKELPSLKLFLWWLITCVARNFLAAVSALTLLLWKVRVNVRLLCSSALISYWPHMASACSHAMLTSGTRITSSHTWPTVQRKFSADTLTTVERRKVPVYVVYRHIYHV